MRQRAPTGLLAVALVAAATLLFSLTSNLTFVGDGWEVLAGRPDWSASTFLQPFNEHPIVLPALVYKTLLTLFGMDSSLPFYVVSISLSLLCAVLLFIYMRRRVGDWAALAGAVLVLFLGAAYEDFLWEYQLGFFGSMAARLGALLALDREDRVGDRLACILLVIANAGSSLGIPFIAAAIAQVALGRRPRWHRAYVPLLPLALYIIWWLGSGHSAGSQIGPDDLLDLPRYIFDAAAAGVASLLGRQPIDGSGHPPALTQILAIILLGGLIYRTSRERRISPGLIVALVLVLTFWALLGLDRGPQRFSSRFQYPSAVFLLIVAAETLKGQRIPRPVLLALVAITVGAVGGEVSLLLSGYSDSWKPKADEIRSTLAAVDIAGAAAHPDYSISLPPSIYISVEQYLDAKRRHGTPAFSEAELLSAGGSDREVADRRLTSAIGLRLRAPMDKARKQGCQTLPPTHNTRPVARLLAVGKFQLENRADEPVVVLLGRFSRTPTVRLGGLPGNASRSMRLPADRSSRPWRLSVKGGSVRLCTIR